MGEFDEAFNAETFQQLHLKLLQERDGQWMVGEGGEAKVGEKEGGVEMMDFWISQSCYLEEDAKCLVKGDSSCQYFKNREGWIKSSTCKKETQITATLVFSDLGRCVSIPNEMPHGLVVEKNPRGAEFEHPVGGMVGSAPSLC